MNMLNVVIGTLVKDPLVICRDRCAHDCTTIAWIYRNLYILPWENYTGNVHYTDPAENVHQCENEHYTRTFGLSTVLTYISNVTVCKIGNCNRLLYTYQ